VRPVPDRRDPLGDRRHPRAARLRRLLEARPHPGRRGGLRPRLRAALPGAQDDRGGRRLRRLVGRRDRGDHADRDRRARRVERRAEAGRHRADRGRRRGAQRQHRDPL
ncbi:MAG: Ethidium bromide-methyl viologen resistance protein EmrE, partial [uncultured Solirubrobacteraceae bacterium]